MYESQRRLASLIAVAMLVGFSVGYSLNRSWKKPGPKDLVVQKSSVRQFLGLPAQITVVSADPNSAKEAVELAQGKILELQKLYDGNDSDFSRINENAGVMPVRVSGETFDFIEKCLAWSRKTGGIFDIAAFTRPAESNSVPDVNGIQNDVPVQGWHFVVLDSNNLSVQVKSKLVKLDPGPVLKAYAVDLALKQIRHLGQKGAMVHIGPEMACFGQAPYKRKSWRVGIPQENNNVQNTNLIPDIVFALNDHAVSTSRFDTAITSSKTQADSNGDSNEVTSLSEFSSITVIAHSAFEAAVLNNCIANVGSSRGLEMIENAQAAAVLVGPAPDYVVIKSRNADAYIRIN